MTYLTLALLRVRALPARLVQSAVIWIWAVTAIRLANFVLILPIALRALSSEAIGLWYLMLNIVGLVTLVEFGLSAAISRQGTFFWAGTGDDENTSGARGPNWRGLRGLIELAGKVYALLGWVSLLACIAGAVTLALTHSAAMLQPSSLAAYGMLSFAAVLRMRGLFWNPLLFGMQRVRESQQIQFTAILLSYAVSLGGLLLGGKLLALASGQVLLLLYPLYRSRYIVRKEMPEIFRHVAASVDWRPIWSATWRAGATVLGSWLGTQGLVFACGQTAGLSISASFAISTLVAYTVHYAAQSWLLAKYPTISSMWATSDRVGIVRLASRRIAFSVATYVVAAAAAWFALPKLLILVGSRTSALPPGYLAALFAAAGLDLFVALHSSVLTSCNLFPHLKVMVAGGILTIITAFILGHWFGVAGVLAAPLICQGCTTLWAVPLICWRTIVGALRPFRAQTFTTVTT